MKNKTKIIDTVMNVATWLLVVLATIISLFVFTSQGNGGIPSIAGYSPINVISDSMAPEFESGDLVVTTKPDVDTLKKGDIITFWTLINNEKALNTHRIVEVRKINDSIVYATKGDANEIEDSSLVDQASIVGVYNYHISGLGNIVSFFQSSNGILFTIVIPLIIFFLYQLYHFIHTMNEYKMEKQREFAQKHHDELLEEAKKQVLEEMKSEK